jgi:hypothetical protein
MMIIFSLNDKYDYLIVFFCDVDGVFFLSNSLIVINFTLNIDKWDDRSLISIPCIYDAISYQLS